MRLQKRPKAKRLIGRFLILENPASGAGFVGEQNQPIRDKCCKKAHILRLLTAFSLFWIQNRAIKIANAVISQNFLRSYSIFYKNAVILRENLKSYSIRNFIRAPRRQNQPKCCRNRQNPIQITALTERLARKRWRRSARQRFPAERRLPARRRGYPTAHACRGE